MRTGEAIWIGVAVCAVAYIWWRVWQWHTRFRWSRALLVPSNQLSWSVPPRDAGEEGSNERRKRKASRRARNKESDAEAGATTSTRVADFAAASTLAAVDPQVLHTIQIATVEQLRNVNSVRDYVRANFHDVSAASAPGWMQRLEDFVAEQQAALTLEKAGHEVRLHADHAGWRWLVDGEPIEVTKGTGAIANAKQALAHIHTATKSKGDMVQSLTDFNHDAITTASKDALSVVHEGLDPGLHLPLGTLLRSAWRELELLFDKKTPIERAVKHVAMDVASVSTGAFLGAKVGGGLGAVVGPLGAGAGLLVGAMAGAIAGRGLAHKSRMAPFTKAFERYESTLGTARAAVESALAESKTEILELESQFQSKFEAAQGEITSSARRELEEIEKKLGEGLKQFLRQFPDYLGALEAQLVEEEAGALAELPPPHWWNWILPRRKDLERGITRRWFQRARKIVKKERRRFEKSKDGPVAPLQAKVHRFLSTYTFKLKSFDDGLAALSNEFTEARGAAEMSRHGALCELEGVRDQMLLDFRGRVSKMYLNLCQTIAGWREKVQASLDELQKQAVPLGIELPN